MERLRQLLWIVVIVSTAGISRTMASPVLVSSTPADGATGVPVTSSVVFAFDVPIVYSPYMFSNLVFLKSAIQWSPNINFAYTISSDSSTLTCTPLSSMPANTTITWTLNPIGATLPIQDFDGSELMFTTGSFTTAGSGTQTNTSATPNVCSISKSVVARQTNATITIPYSTITAIYSVSVYSTNDNPVSAAVLVFPNHSQQSVAQQSGPYHLTEVVGYSSQSLMDTAVPPGSYTFQVQRPSGLISVPMPLSNFDNWPAVPMINNFDQAQSVNASNSFTFQWTPMPGVKPLDGVYFSISNTNSIFSGDVFSAPNSTNLLANTDGAITIPAGLLQSGKTYDGTLTFSRVAYVATNLSDNVVSVAYLNRETFFRIVTTGGVGVSPKFMAYSLNPGNGFTLSISGQAGSSLLVESSTDLSTWNTVISTNVPSSGVVNYTDAAAIGQTARFYRAKSQ